MLEFEFPPFIRTPVFHARRRKPVLTPGGFPGDDGLGFVRTSMALFRMAFDTRNALDIVF